MKTIKVSEATNIQLDWLVSALTNPDWTDEDRAYNTYDYVDTGDIDDEPYSPTTNWAQGGPIIEQESIGITKMHGHGWWADCGATATGPTPLIAAMRCYVSSKMGEEVEVTEELV